MVMTARLGVSSLENLGAGSCQSPPLLLDGRCIASTESETKVVFFSIQVAIFLFVGGFFSTFHPQMVALCKL